MINLLHPTQTAPLPALVPDVSDALPQDALSLAAGNAAPAREPDSAVLDEALSADDLEALSTRQLRIMANQAYRLMDTNYPHYGAADRYEMLVEELEHRAHQATERGTATQTRNRTREAFRNNALYCRFELFIDGSLAAFLKYTIEGGQVVLLDGAEQPGFRDQGVDAILMRHAVLNIHKRRLNLVPQCPMAFSFLADNPEYRTLIAQPRQ